MFWLGLEGVLFASMLEERSASTLQAPQAWVLYLALPVSMLLIVARLALLLFFDRPHA
jgi:TRAP-type C4-dicarboxylate transport system permease small subunit